MIDHVRPDLVVRSQVTNVDKAGSGYGLDAQIGFENRQDSRAAPWSILERHIFRILWPRWRKQTERPTNGAEVRTKIPILLEIEVIYHLKRQGVGLQHLGLRLQTDVRVKGI